MRLQFELPGLPKTTNSGGRKHWSVKVGEARRWKRAVFLAVRASAFMGLPLNRAKVTLTRFSSAEPDFDGLVSSFKHVLDGLVESGVLRSDKQSVIGQPTYRWEKCPPKQGHIQVIVESVEDS